MKKKTVMYIILAAIFFVFTYLFVDRGLNTMIKINIPYQEKSNINYKVILKDNQVYDDKVLDMGKNYISKLVDDIEINFDYKVIFNKYISGYYSYGVSSSLVAYEDDINDPLWEREYKELEDQVKVVNQNKVLEINAQDKVIIDYDKYKKMIEDFKNDYGIDVSGYLLVKVRVHMMNSFQGIDNDIEDEKIIKIIIPLTYDTFKIRVINDYNKIDSYYEFTKKSNVNYLFLVIGALNFSLGVASLSVIIKEMIEVSKREGKYKRELKRILKNYEEEIVNVTRMYNTKDYNLIYVDSFEELLDVYKRVESPISFKEMDKHKKAIFLIIEEDNAWIYQLINEKNK